MGLPHTDCIHVTGDTERAGPPEHRCPGRDCEVAQGQDHRGSDRPLVFRAGACSRKHLSILKQPLNTHVCLRVPRAQRGQGVLASAVVGRAN